MQCIALASYKHCMGQKHNFETGFYALPMIFLLLQICFVMQITLYSVGGFFLP